MRTHHALQPRTPEQASYSIGRRDGKQFLKLYRSYLHGTLAGTREPVYEGTVVESADDWRLTARARARADDARVRVPDRDAVFRVPVIFHMI